MKVAGIVGGLGPESTRQYYKLIIDGYRARIRDGSYPRLLIDSVDLETVIRCMKRGELSELENYLLNSVTRLARAGADFATIAANTPHVVFPALKARSPIPLISIVEVARDGATKAGMRRPGLFGSRFTMQGRFFPDVFEPAGIALVVPTPDEQEFIHEKYMNELVLGEFRPETRAAIVAIARRLIAEDRIDGVILGGTELPLLIDATADIGVPLLDTTRLHVDAIVAAILEPV
ncbi:MAG TPA: amino acid racemase [Opitutaceae bacterium]